MINGKKIHYLVHRLVYLTFNKLSLDTKMDVDHKDNIPINNELSNLTILTRSENVAKGYRDKAPIPEYEYQGGRVDNSKPIWQIRVDDMEVVGKFDSAKEAS